MVADAPLSLSASHRKGRETNNSFDVSVCGNESLSMDRSFKPSNEKNACFACIAPPSGSPHSLVSRTCVNSSTARYICPAFTAADFSS